MARRYGVAAAASMPENRGTEVWHTRFLSPRIRRGNEADAVFRLLTSAATGFQGENRGLGRIMDSLVSLGDHNFVTPMKISLVYIY
jgi:hypothetical protein